MTLPPTTGTLSLWVGPLRTLEAVACTPMFGPVVVQGPRETVPDTFSFSVVANLSCMTLSRTRLRHGNLQLSLRNSTTTFRVILPSTKEGPQVAAG
jgi:hypothetical protein